MIYPTFSASPAMHLRASDHITKISKLIHSTKLLRTYA